MATVPIKCCVSVKVPVVTSETFLLLTEMGLAFVSQNRLPLISPRILPQHLPHRLVMTKMIHFTPWAAQNIDPEFTNVPATREGITSIDPTPTNNAVLNGGVTVPDDGFFDADPGFIGAFGADNWLEGWSILDQ